MDCHLHWLLRLPSANLCIFVLKESLQNMHAPKGSVRELTPPGLALNQWMVGGGRQTSEVLCPLGELGVLWDRWFYTLIQYTEW